MKIFGFEIKRIKKKDYEEAEKFQRIVIAMLQSIDDIKKSLHNISRHMGDLSYISMISNQFAYINNFSDLYMKYKFSSPSSVILMKRNLESVPGAIEKLVDVMEKSKEFEVYLEQLAEREGISIAKAFDLPEARACIHEQVNMLSIARESLNIIAINISTCLSADHLKIINDIDIVEEYYKNSKLKDDNKDGETYNITFKIIPKDKVLSKDGEMKHS